MSMLASVFTCCCHPHTAGSTDEALQQTAEQCTEQIIEVLAGRRPPHLLNGAVWDHRRHAA